MQTEQKIAEVLEANGLVTHADVSVTVKEHKSKPITVVGAVSHPMVYQADRPVTVLEVLAEAGGVANDAGDTVIVARTSHESEPDPRSEEHTSELQSRLHLVCRLLLEKKKINTNQTVATCLL